MLTTASRELHLPGRTVDLVGIFAGDHRGDEPATSLIWMALLVAGKPLRNEHAHELIRG